MTWGGEEILRCAQNDRGGGGKKEKKGQAEGGW